MQNLMSLQKAHGPESAEEDYNGILGPAKKMWQTLAIFKLPKPQHCRGLTPLP